MSLTGDGLAGWLRWRTHRRRPAQGARCSVIFVTRGRACLRPPGSRFLPEAGVMNLILAKEIVMRAVLALAVGGILGVGAVPGHDHVAKDMKVFSAQDIAEK